MLLTCSNITRHRILREKIRQRWRAPCSRQDPHQLIHVRSQSFVHPQRCIIGSPNFTSEISSICEALRWSWLYPADGAASSFSDCPYATSAGSLSLKSICFFIYIVVFETTFALVFNLNDVIWIHSCSCFIKILNTYVVHRDMTNFFVLKQFFWLFILPICLRLRRQRCALWWTLRVTTLNL